jgi:hypothetical protein
MCSQKLSKVFKCPQSNICGRARTAHVKPVKLTAMPGQDRPKKNWFYVCLCKHEQAQQSLPAHACYQAAHPCTADCSLHGTFCTAAYSTANWNLHAHINVCIKSVHVRKRVFVCVFVSVCVSVCVCVFVCVLVGTQCVFGSSRRVQVNALQE